MFTIRQAGKDEDGAAWLQASFNAHMGWSKPPGYFAALLGRQARGEVSLLLALNESAYLGHCIVVWRSAYPGFRERGIPETKDLNVRPEFRRRGIGSALLDEAERLIAVRSDLAGIGFGLYADYGAAQRLYIKRGYMPDGRGLHYGANPAVAGETYRVDDDLALYLVKQLGKI